VAGQGGAALAAARAVTPQHPSVSSHWFGTGIVTQSTPGPLAMPHEIEEPLHILMGVSSGGVVPGAVGNVDAYRFLQYTIARLSRDTLGYTSSMQPGLNSIQQAPHKGSEFCIVDREAIQMRELSSENLARD
jgi:hypothetical protein